MIYPIRFPEAKTVTVQRMSNTQNEMGEIIESWVDDGTIDAEIWPLNGSQSRGEMGVTEKSTHKAFSLGAFESNTRLITDNGMYLVGYAPPGGWGSHYTAILELIF